jgi:glycosyltransferase involved in cell wall biosynthesis
MPKVSIILPNYNYARYLDERIQSLLNQTYKDFELIILDDASTDNSLEVIQKYISDPRVRTQFFTENSGLPYKRWNDGADLAQGEYLLFAGADDSCEPTLIEKLIEKLEHHPSVGLAYSQTWITDSDGKIINSCKNWRDEDKKRWESDYVDRGENEIKYMFKVITIFNASCLLMRRDIFVKVGKFDTGFFMAADYMLYVKMLMISDVAYVSQHLNYFRCHPLTVTRNAYKNGIYFEEVFMVKKFILDNSGLTFESEIILQSYKNRKLDWINFALSLHGVKFLNRNLRIFKLLNNVDKTIGLQLINSLSLKILRKILRLLEISPHLFLINKNGASR